MYVTFVGSGLNVDVLLPEYKYTVPFLAFALLDVRAYLVLLNGITIFLKKESVNKSPVIFTSMFSNMYLNIECKNVAGLLWSSLPVILFPSLWSKFGECK